MMSLLSFNGDQPRRPQPTPGRVKTAVYVAEMESTTQG